MSQNNLQPDVTRRGFVRPGKGHPRARQLAALIDAGCGTIYIEGRHTPSDSDAPRIYEAPDARREWLRSIKRGDVAVVATIGRAGATRGEIGDAIATVHKAGAAIVETSTGRRSDDMRALPDLVLDGVDELRRRHRYSSAEGRAARAKQLAAMPARERMAISKARAIWRDTAVHVTVTAALDAMPGWDARAAYREFGPRHRGDPSRGGRPRKPKA